MGIVTEAEANEVGLWAELRALTDRVRTLNEGPTRSRNLSLVITRLEDAEDRMKRHLAGDSYY